MWLIHLMCVFTKLQVYPEVNTTVEETLHLDEELDTKGMLQVRMDLENYTTVVRLRSDGWHLDSVDSLCTYKRSQGKGLILRIKLKTPLPVSIKKTRSLFLRQTYSFRSKSRDFVDSCIMRNLPAPFYCKKTWGENNHHGNEPSSIQLSLQTVSIKFHQERAILFQYGALLQVNELEAAPCDDSDEDIDEINQQILMELESS